MLVDQIKFRLARDEEFVAVVRQVGVILAHDEDFLAAPFGNGSLRV